MKFKREIAVSTAQHIHTCLPPLHTPFSWEAKQKAFSAQTHPHSQQGRGTAEQRGPGSAAGEMSPG